MAVGSRRTETVRGVHRSVAGALIWLVCLVLPFHQAEAQRVALVVGNAAYETLPVLQNPANDADAVADAMAGLGFEVIRVADADDAELDRALDAFGEASRGAETALFYFAGHGVQIGGSNYLLPTDADVTAAADLREEALDVSRILQVIRDADPRAAVVILDACRDNPLPDVVAGNGVPGGTALTSGLARVEGISGLLIAYATAPGQIAYDGAGANSPFAAALIQYLGRPGLEIGILFRRVRQRVMEMTGGAQIPWVEEALVEPLYLNTEIPPAAAELVAVNAALSNDDATVQLAALADLARRSPDAALLRLLVDRIDRLRGLQLAALRDGEAPPPVQELVDRLSVEALEGTPAGELAAAAFARLHPDSEFAAPAQHVSLQPSEGAATAAPTAADERVVWDMVGRTGDTALLDAYVEMFPDGRFRERAEAARRLLVAGPVVPGAPAAPIASDLVTDRVIQAFVGTGPAPAALSATPMSIRVVSLPSQGTLTARLPDGSIREIDRLSLNAPLIVASLRYTPEPGVRDVVDSFAIASTDPGRGLTVNPVRDEAMTVVLRADVKVHPCDLLAGARFDIQGVVVGNYPNEIDAPAAIAACRDAVAAFPGVPRFRYQLARALTVAGRHDEALPLYVEAAEAGHAVALNALGYAYQQGHGVPQDLVAAVRYFREAAEQGDLYAANNLGIAYRDGLSVERDVAQALDWFVRAAKGGHTFAYNNLGTMYLEGDGVAPDPERAYRLFLASAEAGDIYGFNNMGVLYERGVFVEADPAAAVEWYEKAARGGQPQAPINLGLLYAGGHGVPVDAGKAAYWFAQAARLGNPWGYTNLGWLYRTGTGVEPDPVRSAEMYARAVMASDGSAADRAAAGFAHLPARAPIRAVQMNLVGLGYGLGTPDGIWGPQTADAVATFLSDREIATDPSDRLALLGEILRAADER